LRPGLIRWATRRWGLPGLVVLLAGCSPAPSPVAELTGPTMGTAYRVQLSPPPDGPTLTMLQLRIDERLRQVNRVFSTYLEDSAISRFNRSTSTEWQPAPEELVELVRRAAGISAQTGGRFDITVAPLVRAWGFGSDGARDTPPAAETIDALLREVGYTRLSWRTDPPMLRKQVPGLEIDLSSIAKGWAVDQVGALLEAQGFTSYLVDIGGETLARGGKAGGESWRIAIERPGRQRTAQGSFAATDIAVATSGDYRNYFEHDGRRYSHTIDPLSGQAVRHRLASVTVLAADCTAADAWATALMVLGETEAPALAERLSLAALFIIRADDGLSERATPDFTRDVAWQRLQ
jgi:thiamine biosynthesis lipoprotein